MPRYTKLDSDDDSDSSGEYDAYRDYDPEETETYPEGLYDEDEIPTVPCRHCRAEILEDAEQCPRCGMYQSEEDAPGEPKSRTWIILMALAMLAAIIMTFLG